MSAQRALDVCIEFIILNTESINYNTKSINFNANRYLARPSECPVFIIKFICFNADMSATRQFAIKSAEFCIKNHETLHSKVLNFAFKSAELCIKDEEICIKKG